MSHQGATYERAFGQEDTNDFEIHYSRNKDKIHHVIQQAIQDFSLHFPQHAQYDRNTIIRFLKRGAQEVQEVQENQPVRDFVALAEVQYGTYPTQYQPPTEDPPPPPPPLVLSFDPTGQDVIAERLGYLGNIIDGGSSNAEGSGTGSTVGSELQRQEQLRSPNHNARRRKRNDDRAAQTTNPSAGMPNFEPRTNLSNSRSLPAHPSHQVVSSDIRRRSAATIARGSYQLHPSQSHELEVPNDSSTEIDRFLESQRSWDNRGGLSSFTSVPSQVPRTMGPPSVTHSTQHSPLQRKHKGKRSRPSNSQPADGSVAGTADTVSVAGSDRTCLTCNFEFPFPRDLKIHVQAKHNGGVQCLICNESLSTEYSRKRHVATKHGQGLLCNYGGCNAVFGTEPALNNHRAKEHKDGNQCKECGAIVPSNKYDRHMSDKHNQGEYLCNLCGKRLTSDTSLRSHRKNCRGHEPLPQGHYPRGGHPQ